MITTNTIWEKCGAWLIRQKWPLLIFTALVSVALIEPASRLKLDESIESLYDARDPSLLAYQRSKEAFGGDEFVLVAYQSEDATDHDELRRIRDFAEELSQVPGVQAASTQDLWHTLRNPRATGIVRVALRLSATENALLKLSRHVLIGEDNRTVCIVLRLADEAQSGVPRKVTFGQIRKLAEQHSPRAYVAGEPVQIYDMFRYVSQDSWLLGIASSVLLMIVILIFFRNIRWVILPIVIIQTTLLWTCGLLELSGLKLSMVSSMLTSLITVITIASTMLVTVLYREFREHAPREEAFHKTFVWLAEPFFWISLTTAIGFASLLTSGATPVRSFSIMMALGSMLIPLLCLLILPGGILIGNMQSDPTTPFGEKFLGRQLTRLTDWSENYPWRILGGTIALSVLGIWGLARLSVETDFSKNFRHSSSIVQAIEFFEKNMGGVGSWEVAFDVPHRLEEISLDRVRELAAELRELKLPDGTGLTKVIALTDGLELVPRIPIGEDERRGRLFPGIPRFRDAILKERQEILAELQPEMEPSLYNNKLGRMRIVLRSLEQKPAEVKLELIRMVEETSRKYFPDAKASGLYVLLTNMITSLLGDQTKSIILSTLGITACMVLALRNFKLGLISLIPNLLPLLLVIGGMGWVGIPINIGTAMIASVSLGLTIDNTIMYLEDYQKSRKSGLTHLAAIQAANGSSGLALLIANIALIVGFSVLALSNFLPMVYFGVMVSLAMLGGLIGNLILLPVLIKSVNFNPKISLPAGSLPNAAPSETSEADTAPIKFS